MIDLTLFSTIASAFASFVAIIGGLIASKLITINGEREATNTRITEIDELLELKCKDEESIRQVLDDDDALEYIIDHIDQVEEKAPLSDVYERDEQQRLEFDLLEEYWDIALTLYERFQKLMSEDCETNTDGVPVELATEFSEDDFMYSLCEKFAQLEGGMAWAIERSLSVTAANTKWYNEKRQEQKMLLREIDVLRLQREQVVRQKMH